MKRQVCVLTGGRRGVKILRTGLRVQGIYVFHRERKEKAKLNRKMAPICQGSQADFCLIREVMALGHRERNIDPLTLLSCSNCDLLNTSALLISLTLLYWFSPEVSHDVWLTAVPGPL